MYNPLSICLSSSLSYPYWFLSTLPPLSSVFPQFGDSQQLRLVRILRSTVMVRVGGGWMALDEFLVKNDPCRGKSDTIAGGNMLFSYMEKSFPETLLQDSIILIPFKTFSIFAHHLSFSSMSVLIFSVLSEFTFISSSITSPLLPDLFPMVIFICMAYTFGPFFLSLFLPVILLFYFIQL